MPYVVALEGFLKNPTGSPIREAVDHFRILTGFVNVIIVSDSSRDEANAWLRQHGIRGHSDVRGNDMYLPGMSLRRRQLEVLRSNLQVSMFIDSNPDNIADAMDMGIPCMMFQHHRDLPPSTRIDRSNSKSWADLIAQLDERMSPRFADEGFGE